jgi:hypothetical protein
MILNASFVCLHAFSLRRESPDPDPRRRTPHFWGGSVTLTLFIKKNWPEFIASEAFVMATLTWQILDLFHPLDADRVFATMTELNMLQ